MDTYPRFLGRVRHLGFYFGMRQICQIYKVSLSEMYGPRRFRSLVLARREIWRMLRVKYRKSYGEIAELFGRDHNTIMMSLRREPEVSSLKGNTP